MARVKSANTALERQVRSVVHDDDDTPGIADVADEFRRMSGWVFSLRD